MKKDQDSGTKREIKFDIHKPLPELPKPNIDIPKAPPVEYRKKKDED